MGKTFVFKAKAYPPRHPTASGGLRFVVGKLHWGGRRGLIKLRASGRLAA